ncbi:hypothetical protein [Hasllibacter sp. MH4015]|uniref:hypothetical protein n=1 Tax=Hasllibacter sp. MH4015 TaxID=2854029 RepID=UPI00351D55F2
MAFDGQNAKLKKLPAVQMIYVATLEEIHEKSSEAQLIEQGCEMGHEEQRFHSAAGLRVCRSRSAHTPACIEAPD